MSSRLQALYYPLTVPHPERLRKWSQSVDYRHARILASGPVVATGYRISSPTPGARGKRIAFAADFHYAGSAFDRKLTAAAAEQIKRLEPDYLCIGGDLSADAVELSELPGMLSLFRECAPQKLAIPGNWERGKTWLGNDFWQQLYAGAGFHYLCNDAFEDERFFFYGTDDLTNGDPRLPESWPENKANILLIHRPDTVIALDTPHALAPVSLILCGHTHGGQIRLPFLGPLYASSQYGCRLAYGLFERRNGSPRMIVSSGISNRSLRWRFNCRREVVLIEFV